MGGEKALIKVGIAVPDQGPVSQPSGSRRHTCLPACRHWKGHAQKETKAKKFQKERPQANKPLPHKAIRDTAGKKTKRNNPPPPGIEPETFRLQAVCMSNRCNSRTRYQLRHRGLMVFDGELVAMLNYIPQATHTDDEKDEKQIKATP